MAIATRLTKRLGITHPILSAPMDLAAGGRLAAAVSTAGGLGFLGGGYAESEAWLDEAFQAAGNQAVGCGFITWALRRRPHLLDQVIARRPAAVFLSFDDPEPFASKIKAAGIPVICQLQTRADALRAIECGVDMIVAQGGEAGGHGGGRATLTLVPEVVDLIAAHAPDTLLCAAGGIADGRGLAAALMLGADGVVVGSRFWAATEAQVHPNLHAAALAATGDDTIRQSVLDIVRERPWPARYTGRVLKNQMITDWLGREDALRRQVPAEAQRYASAAQSADPTIAATIVGEAVGLIHTIEPAATIIARMVAEAEGLLQRGAKLVE
jgi:nitronate monooxygenase